MSPRRLQRQRTRGWRKPDGAVIVTRPGKWGNPFPVTPERTADEAVALFREWVTPEYVAAARAELRGRDLMCWCRLGAPCHGDVLLEFANAEDGS